MEFSAVRVLSLRSQQGDRNFPFIIFAMHASLCFSALELSFCNLCIFTLLLLLSVNSRCSPCFYSFFWHRWVFYTVSILLVMVSCMSAACQFLLLTSIRFIFHFLVSYFWYSCSTHLFCPWVAMGLVLLQIRVARQFLLSYFWCVCGLHVCRSTVVTCLLMRRIIIVRHSPTFIHITQGLAVYAFSLLADLQVDTQRRQNMQRVDILCTSPCTTQRLHSTQCTVPHIDVRICNVWIHSANHPVS